jgi:outer membrane protein assembly factor BamB
MLRLSKKLKVLRERLAFPSPVIARDAIYAGERDYDLAKFDRKTLELQWRLPAEGFDFVDSCGDVVLLKSLHTARSRGLRADGSIAWTLERMGRVGWNLWRDHLYAIEGDIGMVLADPLSGQVVGPNALVLRPNEVFQGICEDVVLLQDRAGDPFRAYDLVREEVLWERNLLSEIRARYDARAREPMPQLKPAGPGLLVCSVSGSGLYGVDLRDGRLLWGFPVITRTINPAGGRIYVWATTSDLRVDRFLCLAAATGERLYEVTVKVEGPWLGAMSARHIVYTARSGFIGVFRLSDGLLVWTPPGRMPRLGAPVIDGKRVFVPTDLGLLLVLDGEI